MWADLRNWLKAHPQGSPNALLYVCVGFFLHSSTWPRLGALGFAVAYAGLVGWLNRARKQQTDALEHAVTANAELRSALTTVQTDQARMREQLQVITNRGGVR